MAEKKKTETDKETTVRKKCGIVMPIAGFNGYPEEHWRDVKEIIIDAADMAGFDAELVSYRNETAVIHKTIIQNLYTNDIVVVDVSGRNPNVMFELGMRLAFDKPTIIIKDEKTDYSFDTAPIDHLPYLSSLHYQTMRDFKEDLSKKILATYDASLEKHYSSFLKNFGDFTVAKIEQKEVSEAAFLLNQLRDLIKENQNARGNIENFDDGQQMTMDPSYLNVYWKKFLAVEGHPIEQKPTLRTINAFKTFLGDEGSSYRMKHYAKASRQSLAENLLRALQ